MLKVAFIGCGRISDLHALGYQNYAGACLHGVYDPDMDRAEEKARAWGASRVYRELEELLADDQVGLVEILTPHHTHCELAVAAARAGKHISVQKPIALTLEEADRMIAAAREAQVLLRVYENFVYYAPYVKARQLLEAGEIGQPLSLNLRVRSGCGKCAWEVPLDAWAWRFNPETGGGCPLLFDHGYHNYSLALYLLGEVEKVFAWSGQAEVVPGSGLCLNSPAMVTWRYRSGAYGVKDAVYAPELQIDTRHYADEARLEITGEKGVIFVNRCTGRLQNRPPVELYRDGVTTAFEDMPAGWEESFIQATRDLVEALAEGRQPLLSGEQGRQVLELALAVQQSLEREQVVHLQGDEAQ